MVVVVFGFGFVVGEEGSEGFFRKRLTKGFMGLVILYLMGFGRFSGEDVGYGVFIVVWKLLDIVLCLGGETCEDSWE